MTAKKKKKAKQPEVRSSYKRFIVDLAKTLDLFGLKDKPLNAFSTTEKKEIFNHKYVISAPKKGNDEITQAELREFDRLLRDSLYEKRDDVANYQYSLYDLLLMCSYLQALQTFVRIDKKAGRANESDVKKVNETMSDLFDVFIQRYLLFYYKVITQKNYPDKKYYGIAIDSDVVYSRGLPRFALNVFLYGFPIQKTTVRINNIKRPVFRLAKPMGSSILEWISIPVEILGKSYNGTKEEIEVYIQSHALQRMKERLDILDDSARNYTLWENTATLAQIDRYKGFYLIPYKIMKVKVGYLVGRIIDDKFVISTFLFITHNSSPEGEKLKKLTGLTSQEISYWKVDRLSAFIDFSEDRYPVLMKLFEEAGIGNLKELKNQKLDVDTLQHANLKDFALYVRKNIAYKNNLTKP